MKTKHGIIVESYVHTDDGLVNFDDLSDAQKQEAATQIKIAWMNGLYRQQATFTEAKE